MNKKLNYNKKILIIPIPKSASSSLRFTLKELHNIDYFKVIGIGKDVRDLEQELNKDDYFIMGHILPTKKNITFLRNYKKVIHLRDPEECKKAFIRGKKAYIHSTKGGALSGFNYDFFYNGWIKNIDKRTIVIHYKDLIQSPKETINRIERHFSLPLSKKVKLKKVKYSKSKILKLKGYIFFKLRGFKILRKIKNRYFPKRLYEMTKRFQ